jgi:hypothetical protein
MLIDQGKRFSAGVLLTISTPPRDTPNQEIQVSVKRPPGTSLYVNADDDRILV